MLEKNAEDRYQTATGITEDIQQLEDIIRFNQRVENFELARGDLLSKFEIPTKIYGRTEEKNKILNMVHLTANSKSRVLLVNGYSGIGKTALVNEVKKPIIPSEEEISENPRSRSAKLRILKRVSEKKSKNKYEKFSKIQN